MNYKNGSALAIQQSVYLQRYLYGGSFTKKEIKEMESNLWVATASKLAPSNLVIRQYALIDIMKKVPAHVEAIFKQMKILTFDTKDELKIWAEGYSYYCYTRDVLDEWCKLFSTSSNISNITKLINQIDNGFLATAYEKNNVLYPMLFGDLRNEPLRYFLQIRKPDNFNVDKVVTISNVFYRYNRASDTAIYIVKGRPVGLNSHIPKDNYEAQVLNGNLIGFNFYEGYDKKYKNKLEEIGDYLNIIKKIIT